jgi:hypothetical protein
MPPRCLHTRTATWNLPGCRAVAGSQTACMSTRCPAVQWQFLKLPTSTTVTCRAREEYQTACTRALFPCRSGWIPNCMHERAARCSPAAVAGYQTACARGCPAAVAGSQTA